MGMIPQLKTAFCGFSLRTGTKIIGWLAMLIGFLEFILATALIGVLAFNLASTDDEEVGKEAVEMRHHPEKFDVKDIEGLESFLVLFTVLIEGMDKDLEPEDLGRRLKQQLQGFFIVMFFVSFIIFLIHIFFTSLLLVGAHKKRSGYVLLYLVIMILGLVGYIPVIFGDYASNLKMSTLIGCLIHLYFTWVLYSFYRELRHTSSKYTSNSMVMLVPGHKHLEGDVPMLAPTATPNDYYYPEKK